jgi:hypothetical protein
LSVDKCYRKGAHVVNVSAPQGMSVADAAFPAQVIGKLLPFYEDIPEEFRRDDTPWNALVNEWFFRGLKGATFKAKDGIDRSKALAHVDACMRSFQPSHEHKTAGCAYLLSCWFESVERGGRVLAP